MTWKYEIENVTRDQKRKSGDMSIVRWGSSGSQVYIDAYSCGGYRDACNPSREPRDQLLSIGTRAATKMSVYER